MLAQSIRAYPLQLQLNFAVGKGWIEPPYSNCFLVSFAVRIQVIFSQSRGNLLVCKELTLETMKSANFNFPHNQFNSKESVVFFLLACDHALSLYLCNLFSQAKEVKKQKKNNA